MASGVPQPASCCNPCDDSTINTQIPGPAGAAGAAGSNGTNGVNAFTTTTAGFVMPAVAATVVVAVLDSTWMAIGQKVFVQGAGFFTVDAKPTALSATLNNLGYTGNAAPAAVIANTQQVSPAGIKGVDGGAGTTDLDVVIDATFGATSARGQLLVDNGAAAPNSNAVKMAAGTNGQILVADSTAGNGLAYKTSLPLVATDNGIPRFDGAAGTPIPLQTSFVIITDTGAIQASGSGGNARGVSATDLQVVRGGVAQVASGLRAGILSGQNNTASGIDSAVAGGDSNIASATNTFVGGGTNNTATVSAAAVGGGDTNAATAASAFIGGGTNNAASGGASAIAGGEDNSASGGLSFIGGGQLNIASGLNSGIVAGTEASASHTGEVAHANGGFSSTGDAQVSDFVLRRATANATPAELFLDGAALRMTIPDDTTWTFDILIVARRTDANDESAAYRIVGCIDRNVGVGTTSLVGAITKTVIAEDTAAWDCTASADAAAGALVIFVTGEAAKSLNWVSSARVIQTTG